MNFPCDSLSMRGERKGQEDWPRFRGEQQSRGANYKEVEQTVTQVLGEKESQRENEKKETLKGKRRGQKPDSQEDESLNNGRAGAAAFLT